MENKQIKVRIHPENHRQIKVFAAEDCKSINFIINQAIREYILKRKENGRETNENKN